MDTTLKTFEVSIPQEYTQTLKQFVKVLKGKVKSQKRTGLDEALDDIKAGRIHHAGSTEEMMKEIVG